MEILPQAAQAEVNRFRAASAVRRRRAGSQGSASPAVMVADFVGDVLALVGDFVGGHDLILWMRNKDGGEKEDNAF